MTIEDRLIAIETRLAALERPRTTACRTSFDGPQDGERVCFPRGSVIYPAGTTPFAHPNQDERITP